MKYFENYSGGIEDVKETFDLFADILEKAIIPDFSIPDLERIKKLFDSPASLLGRVRLALFESNDPEGIEMVVSVLRRLKVNLDNLAELYSAKPRPENKEDNLEYRILKVLKICVEKLAALLTFKRVQIVLLKDNKQD